MFAWIHLANVLKTSLGNVLFQVFYCKELTVFSLYVFFFLNFDL